MQEFCQLQLFCHLQCPRLVLFRALQQLVLHIVRHEQRRDHLRQHTELCALLQLYLAAIRLFYTGKNLQERCLARAVAAEQTENFILMQRDLRAAQDILAALIPPEPELLCAQHFGLLCG